MGESLEKILAVEFLEKTIKKFILEFREILVAGSGMHQFSDEILAKFPGGITRDIFEEFPDRIPGVLSGATTVANPGSIQRAIAAKILRAIPLKAVFPKLLENIAPLTPLFKIRT